MPVAEPRARASAACVNQASLVADLHRLGVEPGDSLVVKSAISEVGWVEGGVKTVLDALLAAVGVGGSVFGLSFTRLYPLPLTRESAEDVFTRDTPTYTGSLNNLMLKHPGAVRSPHPSNSYVGVGPQASAILSKHSVSCLPYYPVYELAQHDNSKALLLGTIDKNPGVTTTHVAQNLLGLRNDAIGRYGVRFFDPNGEVKLYVRNHVGGCSRGFGRFYPHYRRAGAVSEGRVGNARSMLVKLKTALSVDIEILRKDPGYFFCRSRRPLCYACTVSWDHSPLSTMRAPIRHARRVLSSVRRLSLRRDEARSARQ